MLKIYGDAPDTVSVSTRTCAFAELNPPDSPAGRLPLTNGRRYINFVSLTTLDTFVEIL